MSHDIKRRRIIFSTVLNVTACEKKSKSICKLRIKLTFNLIDVLKLSNNLSITRMRELITNSLIRRRSYQKNLQGFALMQGFAHPFLKGSH